MLILKIRDKGLYIEIPGALPTRTPADINISKCNISVVEAHLRKNGISNYQIVSVSNKPIITKSPTIKDSSINQKIINQRFSNLERMMAQLLEKQQAISLQKREQITDKLDKLESLSKKILKQEPRIIEKIDNKSEKKGTKIEPKIEELDPEFIPSINISKMKIKGKTKKTVKQDKHNIDDSADLLSRIMGNED